MALGPRERATQVRPELLQPRAEPIDTFVRVGPQVEDNSLTDFARGLSKLDASLGSFLAERKLERDKEDALRGEQEFHRNNAMGYEQAVREGKIPAFASKSFVESYKRAQGDLAGIDLTTKFRAAYNQWDGKDSDDPEAYNRFAQDFVSKNIGANADPHVLAGLLPRLRAMVAGGAEQNIKDRDQSLRSRALNTRVAQADNDVDAARADGLGSPKGMDYGKLFTGLEARRSEMAARLGADKANEAMADLVAAKAIEMRDPKLLRWFSQRVPGTNYSHGDTEYGRKVKAETTNRLDEMGRKGLTEEARLKKENDARLLEDATRDTIAAMLADPQKPIPEELLKRGSKIDEKFRINALGWQKTLVEARGRSDPQAVLQLQWEVLNGGGMAAINRGLSNGTITNREDLQAAVNLNKQVTEQGEKVNKIAGGDSAKRILDTIKQRTASDQDLSAIFAPDGLTDKGLAAQFDFRRMLYEWAAKNPNASLSEQEKAVAEIGSAVLGRITGAGTGDGTKYTPDPGNPHQPGQPSPQQLGVPTPGAPPPAATPPTAPQGSLPLAQPPGGQPQQIAPQQPAATPEVTRSWYNTLQPGQQEAIKRRAEQEGRPLDEVASELYQHGVSRGLIRPIAQRTSFGDSSTGALPTVREVVDGWRAMDPEAAAVLDRAVDAFTQPQGTGRRAPIPQDFEGGTPAPGGHSWADMAKAIRWGAKQTGADPEDLATLISFESRFNTRVMGGAGGRHLGLIQFGTQEQQDYGAHRDQTPMEQMQAVVKYLKHRGYKPGMSFLDLYSTVNAGSPGLGHRSDAKNGGTWGTVADKVNYQMAGHREKARALLAANPEGPDEQSAAAAVPQEVARNGAPGRFGPNDVYANIPDADDKGNTGQVAKFLRWNPDPVGNHEKKLSEVKPQLQDVVRRAMKDNPGLKFVVGAGGRSEEEQKMAEEWGWSPKSRGKHPFAKGASLGKHIHGDAVDIWPLDDKGRVNFDQATLAQVGVALKTAAQQLGVKIKWGGDFKGKKDLPHFEIDSSE